MQELLLKLPRLIAIPDSAQDQLQQQMDELVRLGNLKTLYGYLRLAGDSTDNKSTNISSPTASNLMSFFHLNMQNVSRLLEALLTCIHFDYKSLNNLYEMTSSTGESATAKEDLNTLSNYSGLDTYLADRTLFDQLCVICEYLSGSDAVQMIVDELLTNEGIYLQHRQCSESIQNLLILFEFDSTPKNSLTTFRIVNRFISFRNFIT